MEVVTLVGGFRGLGDLTTSQAYALSTWLQQSLAETDQLISRVRAASASGQIPTASGQVLEQQYDALNQRAIDLGNQLLDATHPADAATWRAAANALIADASIFNDQAHLALGDIQARGLKLLLLILGSTALLGGTAYVIYRYGKRKHPRRRR